MDTKLIELRIPQFEMRPAHVGGDKEFKGHGPIISVVAMLVQNGDTSLDLVVYMHAIESQSDFTEFREMRSQKVLDLRERPDCQGYSILSVEGSPYNAISYFEKDHKEVTNPPTNGGTLVETFTTRGDFSGEDQPYVVVRFKQQRIRIAKSRPVESV